MQTIENNFGIHIEHYVGVNFSLLADLIDQIGGLTLTVESEYYMDRINAVIKEDNKVLGLNENDGLLTQAVRTADDGQARRRPTPATATALPTATSAAPPVSARSSPRSSIA